MCDRLIMKGQLTDELPIKSPKPVRSLTGFFWAGGGPPKSSRSIAGAAAGGAGAGTLVGAACFSCMSSCFWSWAASFASSASCLALLQSDHASKRRSHCEVASGRERRSKSRHFCLSPRLAHASNTFAKAPVLGRGYRSLALRLVRDGPRET